MSLTKEEQEILASVEAGEWRSVANVKALAHASQRKDKRVNIRMTERDLLRFKKKGGRRGVALSKPHIECVAQVH